MTLIERLMAVDHFIDDTISLKPRRRNPDGPEAADAIAARDARIAELEGALQRCGQIVERNLYRQHEKIEDVPRIARTTLGERP